MRVRLSLPARHTIVPTVSSQRMMAIGLVLIGLIAIGMLLSACGRSPRLAQPENAFGLPPHALSATVERVVDGDTVTVSIGSSIETLRLLGIDTPEKPGGPRPAECHGQEATAVAELLLPAGTQVFLARDSEPRDLYGRLLAYVYRAEDGVFVNLHMLQEGAAAPLSIAPNTTFDDVFASAADTARRERVGLWGTCGGADVVLSE